MFSTRSIVGEKVDFWEITGFVIFGGEIDRNRNRHPTIHHTFYLRIRTLLSNPPTCHEQEETEETCSSVEGHPVAI